MAGTGIRVKDVLEIKRLANLGITNRQIAKALGIHRNTVNKYVDQLRAENKGTVFFAHTRELETKNTIDWEKVRSEFLSGVSLNVIHEELLESNQTSVTYSGFWKQVQRYANLSEATMVRIFKPGERCEIDYVDGINVMDLSTGELRKTEFFVGVLCNSRYTFAEFTWSQKSADFLESHVNMFEYFGGTPQVLSPDNLKSAVTKAHRYDPTINQAYTRLAEYYEIAVVPARVRTPKDKAIVERTIQIFQRYFFMKVRNRRFTSLLELNQCLRDHLVIFNQKQHRIFKRSRLEMFEDERAHLKALPMDRYKVATYNSAKLGRDCHLEFDGNFYSASHLLRGRKLDVWASSKVVEIYSEGERTALHARYAKDGRKFKTDKSHYPPAQQAYAEENVQNLISKADQIGAQTSELVRGLFKCEAPLKHFRRVQGIVALAWRYSPELLESAAGYANKFNHPNVQYLERVIKMKKGVSSSETSEIKQRSFNPHLRGIKNINCN